MFPLRDTDLNQTGWNRHNVCHGRGSVLWIADAAPVGQSFPEAMGGYLPLSKVYSYDPVPAELSEREAELVCGVQANLWAEYIFSDSHYEYMIYPRALALAEIAWRLS